METDPVRRSPLTATGPTVVRNSLSNKYLNMYEANRSNKRILINESMRKRLSDDYLFLLLLLLLLYSHPQMRATSAVADLLSRPSCRRPESRVFVTAL